MVCVTRWFVFGWLRFVWFWSCSLSINWEFQCYELSIPVAEDYDTASISTKLYQRFRFLIADIKYWSRFLLHPWNSVSCRFNAFFHFLIRSFFYRRKSAHPFKSGKYATRDAANISDSIIFTFLQIKEYGFFMEWPILQYRLFIFSLSTTTSSLSRLRTCIERSAALASRIVDWNDLMGGTRN